MSDRVDMFFLSFNRLPHNKPDEKGNIQTPDGHFGVMAMAGPRVPLLELEYNNKALVATRSKATPGLSSEEFQKIMSFVDTDQYRNWIFDPNPEGPDNFQAIDCLED